ncbi:MAG: carboxypeptidase-like regulatory domain-containing protein [Bryobacteraceae bacterium]|jgi:hypothetical protein
MSLLRACIACAVFLAAAQAEEVGSLAGVVTDLSGSVIPGAQLTLRGAAGEVARILSGGEGEFRFSSLPSGTYSINARAPGLVSMTLEDIRVEHDKITVAIIMTVASRYQDNCDPGPKIKLDPIQPGFSEVTGVVEGPVPIPSPETRTWVPRPVENVLITASGPTLLTETGPKHMGLVVSTHTDKDGRFTPPIQGPGLYTITAHRYGYADFIVDEVVASKGQRTTIRWHLPLEPCPSPDGCKANRRFLSIICM